MKINNLINSLPKFPSEVNPKRIQGTSFGDTISDFVKEVNKEQKSSNQLIQDFVDGKDVELHEVMIAGEKAKTSLQLLMEIRNKAIDMYKELTRMQ